jgi:pyruvate dehydrogenase (quinone)
MSQKVADFMLTRLKEWDIERIYGYPGDGINGIVGALDRHSEAIDFI